MKQNSMKKCTYYTFFLTGLIINPFNHLLFLKSMLAKKKQRWEDKSGKRSMLQFTSENRRMHHSTWLVYMVNIILSVKQCR